MMTVLEAASTLNEDQARVSVQAPDWSKLAQEGAIVKMHVGRWRGKATLTMRDIGLVNDDAEANAAMAKLVQLGSRLLLPRRVVDELMRLETLSRNTLRRFSIQTLWGFFVPRKAYAAWAEENERVRQRYLSYARWVADEWDGLTREVYDGYVALGWQNYRRLRDAGVIGNDVERDEWVKNFAQRATSITPTAGGFLATVSYDWEVGYVPFTSGQGELPGEAIDAMDRDIRATLARKASEDIGRFVADIQAGIRERVLEVAEMGLARLKDKGALGRGASTALNNLIEQVERLKFWPDENLDAKLREIAELMEVRADKRENGTLAVVLRQLSEESRLILKDLDRPAERGLDDRAFSVGELDLAPRAKRDDSRRMAERAIDMLGDILDADPERDALDRDIAEVLI